VVRSTLRVILVVAILVGAGFYYRDYHDRQEQKEVERSELDKIVVALREDRNRLQVHRIGGETTTVRSVRGGPGDILSGSIQVRQPFTVDYFVDMNDVSLNDYIWDHRTRTLMVRTPFPQPDAPNVDGSRQIVATQGIWITRGMQNELRKQAAAGAKQQAVDEAKKPENIVAATRAARTAIVTDVRKPLAAVGLSDITVVATDATGVGQSAQRRWDVSRSIAQVLAEMR
jgi:hypothetical protein